MQLRFRKATTADANDVAELEFAATASLWGFDRGAEEKSRARQVWRETIASEAYTVFVAELDGEVVAEAAVTDTREDDGGDGTVSGSAHLSSIAVVPRLWARGVAGQLLRHVTGWLRDQGYKVVECWTEVDNLPSTRLYESQGWIRQPQIREHPPSGRLIVQFIHRLE